MAFWSTSRASDLQTKIDDIQHSLAALSDIVGSNADQASKRASRGLHRVEERVQSGAHDISSSVVPMISDLGRQIETLLSVVTSVTGGFARKAGKESRQAYNTVEEKIEDNAVLAVLAAAGVGFLLGAAVVGSATASRSSNNDERRRPASRVE
ncbi:hypothetical protein [Terrihabitans sp. B22-R8]|uniref:hypothetical protein n=1 Tax=Terrihabitans sp. B22-R8 TaxID=3425128 RepID=UPI00403CE520